MDVAIVTVGDELLSGDTTNTNATWLCDRLDERGVSVRRVTTIPDVIADIARVVNEYNAEYDAVLVTGGLGPTHDDVTMEGVAAAFGREVESHAAARTWLREQGGYEAGDLVAGTTHLPEGARMLPNTEGVAPGAVVETVYVFPGVPDEMIAMFEAVEDEFSGAPTYTISVETSEPESALIDRFAELRDRFDVTVGSYPGDSVRVKLTSGDEEAVAAAADWLQKRVAPPDSGDESDAGDTVDTDDTATADESSTPADE